MLANVICNFFCFCLSLLCHQLLSVLSFLTGAILTCKKGTLDERGTRTDVDKEFVLLFAVMDENKSWLLDENIARFCADADGAMTKKTDGGFVKSNKMYSINGRVFGNLEGLDMCLGEKISWHLYGIGTDTDVHAGIAFINPCKRLRPSPVYFTPAHCFTVYVFVHVFVQPFTS